MSISQLFHTFENKLPRQNIRPPGNPISYNLSPHRLPVSQTSQINSDKATSIIQSWGLKFDGSSGGINVEEFLYRIRSLTEDHFNGDFSVILKNLNTLLVGKAKDWYWRYHKQISNPSTETSKPLTISGRKSEIESNVPMKLLMCF